MNSAKVVFLDRDGVINWDPIGDYIKHPEDFRFFPGVGEALKRLTQAGYKIVVISNQAGIGDGVFTEEALEAVNQRFLEESKKAGAKIFDVFYCLHGKNAGCSCRKPKTGLFEKAKKNLGEFDKDRTFFIGDKISDIQAGKDFGIRTIFVLTGHGSKEKEKIHEPYLPDHITEDLGRAVDFLLKGAPQK
jgi:D-glycero-D-manno-heptose 1,7-bisphosphate phosphatase